MTHVATLVSDPARPALDGATLERAAGALPRAGATRWLSPGVAADIPFEPASGQDARMLAEAVRAVLAAPADVAVQPLAGRRKRLLIADMDSTLIGQECIDELADELGLKEHVAAITERAMRGEIEFEPALRERVGLLAGLPAGVVDKVLAERITLTPGGRALVMTMRRDGGYAALVSGGFTVFTGPIARQLGFDEHRSNVLEAEDGVLAGSVREPILGREAKLSALVELRDRLGLSAAETLAVGDGANDLDMLGEAGLGVAFHAKPAVAAAAHARIDHSDLSALLFLQGYSADEFAA